MSLPGWEGPAGVCAGVMGMCQVRAVSFVVLSILLSMWFLSMFFLYLLIKEPMPCKLCANIWSIKPDFIQWSLTLYRPPDSVVVFDWLTHRSHDHWSCLSNVGHPDCRMIGDLTVRMCSGNVRQLSLYAFLSEL